MLTYYSIVYILILYHFLDNAKTSKHLNSIYAHDSCAIVIIHLILYIFKLQKALWLLFCIGYIYLDLPTCLPASWETCMQVKKQQLEQEMDQWTGSKLGKEYIKAVYYHPSCLTYM